MSQLLLKPLFVLDLIEKNDYFLKCFWYHAVTHLNFRSLPEHSLLIIVYARTVHREDYSSRPNRLSDSFRLRP